MKKYIVSFGGLERGKNRHNESYGIHRDYTSEVHRLFESAKPYFDDCFYYDNDWFENSSYCKNNPWVLKEDSYGWCFKPIVIQDALNKIEDKDVLMWCDSNHVIMANPRSLIDIATTNNIFCHEHHNIVYYNKNFTHKDMFVKMNCDESRYWDAPQMQVNIMVFYRTDFTINFVQEWVNFAVDYDTMIKNEMENLPRFDDHRHEQSIFSILREKYNLPYYLYPFHIVHERDGIHLIERGE